MKKPYDFTAYCLCAIQSDLDIRKGSELVKIRTIVNKSLKMN